MTARRFVVLVALATLVVVGLTVAPLASAVITQDAPLTDEEATLTGDEEPRENLTTRENRSTMGSEVSAFMQSSAADADGSVEAGMFTASYENTPEAERGDIVLDRTDRLEERFESIEAAYEELREREDGMNPAAYDAQMTRLTVQLVSLERAITETAPRAEDAGVDDGRLDALRSNASELSGPEVAAIATRLAGVDPPGHANGPPGRANDLPANADGPPGRVDGAADDTDDATEQVGEGNSTSPANDGNAAARVDDRVTAAHGDEPDASSEDGGETNSNPADD